MNRILKIAVTLLAALSMAACTSGGMVKFSDGSTLEVRSKASGATEYAAAQYTDAATGKKAVDLSRTDSMGARIIPGVAQVATGGLINYATAVKVQDMKSDQCGDGCGGGGSVAQIVLQSGAVTAGANAIAETASQSTSSTNCPGGVCLGTMD